ncbi:hypothetical protein KBA73_04930 [Patescibacteria group bacterium]|nr:hypothetical protein [Patescibacteria group bacterium]
MYINNEFVPMPLLVVMGLVILTVILTKWWGEPVQYQTGLSPRRRLAIQLACIAPMGVALVLLIGLVVASQPSS